MSTSRHRWLVVCASLLVLFTYGLVVLGSAVRANNAGLACPDWPLCFGEVVPAIDFHVAFEFGHRVVAGFVSLGFLALAIGILRVKELRQRLGALLGIAAVVLVVQIVLGGLTVLELLAQWTVTSHLLTGNTFCLLLFLIALRLRELDRPVVRDALAPIAKVGAAGVALVLLLQLALGGLVSSSHAGLACGTWPTCNGGSWFPFDAGHLVGLQVMHRIMAYTVFAVIAIVALVARGRGRFGRAALVLFGLVSLQVALGVANVLLYLPVEVTVLHSAGAAALVLATTYLNAEAWRAPSPAAISGAHSSVRSAQEVG